MHTFGLQIQFLRNHAHKHRDKVITIRDFLYKPSGLFFVPETIPSGTVTDFASIPDKLDWFEDPNSKLLREGALFHDDVYKRQDIYLEKYWHRLDGNTDKEKRECLRLAANKEMKLKCIEQGLSRIKADLVFFAIHYSRKGKKAWENKGLNYLNHKKIFHLEG